MWPHIYYTMLECNIKKKEGDKTLLRDEENELETLQTLYIGLDKILMDIESRFMKGIDTTIPYFGHTNHVLQNTFA